MVSVRPDDTDLPNDSNTCTADTCNAGAPVYTPRPNQPCGTSGICNDAGQCVGCVAPTDCSGTDDFCKTRTCSNNVCGLSYTAVDTALPSQTAGDCVTRVCDGQGGIRSNATSTDVYVDGNPCTVDLCAGTTPQNPPTGRGRPATSAAAKSATAAAQCVACLTPPDCGNPVGFPCVVATCSTNQCGTANAPNTTPCGDPASCTGGVAVLADKCTNGTCTDSGTQNCTPFVCGPTACNTSCADNAGCSVGGESCDTGLGVCTTGQKCTDYCNAIASTCTGTYLQYYTNQACLRSCAKLPKGSSGGRIRQHARLPHDARGLRALAGAAHATVPTPGPVARRAAERIATASARSRSRSAPRRTRRCLLA